MKPMKLFTNLSVALICIALFTGCKKDSKPTQPPQSSCKITTIAVSGANAVSIAYNNDGTVSTITSGTGITSYVYSGNTITETTMNSGQFDTKAIITKNGDGLATNVRTEYSADGTDWDNEAYEYNGTQVIKLTYTSSNGGSSDISTFQWSGGNLVSVIDTGDTTKIDYFTDKLSQGADYLSLSQFIQGYEVFRNKNILKSITNGTDVTNVTYTYDTDGKITSLTENDGTDTYNYSFQYQCN
ncbi:MAG TPA: hypothetical protein VFI29_22525 [Hanamia sp.]|nr:hypothetical protein [Hanamia sp.]